MLKPVSPSLIYSLSRTAACIVPRLPYPQPPDDSVISVPTQILDGYPARNMPRGIDDQGKQLVFINKNNPEIDVTGKVPREDLYVIIAEYYQPNHPEVTISFLIMHLLSIVL